MVVFVLGVTILSLFPNAALVIGQTTSTPFPDISTDNINYEAISYLKDNGIIQGYPDGTYKPAGEINRAEFTKIIIGALTETPSGKNCFSDVKDEWFAPFICEAKSRKIVSGYEDGTYKPADRIKFSEASKIIANAFGLSSDDSDPNVWYKKYVTALSEKKAIPLSVDYFDEYITRDEMAEMIWRIKADVETHATRTYDEIQGSGLVKGYSCSDLQERYQSSAQNYYDGGIMYKDVMPVMEQAAPAGAADSISSSTGAGASSDYSTTNIQVEGVDEADIIKNDGKFIYIVKGGTVRIVEAYPAANLKELVTLTLGDKDETFTPQELFVNNEQLVVIGSVYNSYPEVIDSTTTTTSKMIAPDYYPYWNNQRSKIFILDIKDRTKPVVTRWVEFDGSYTTSRRIGDTMYLILNKNMYFPPIYRPMADSTSASSTTDLKPEELVPQLEDSTRGKTEAMTSCRDIYIVPKTHDTNYIIAAAVPLNDLTREVKRSVVVGNSQNVYSSLNNLYVASTDWSGPYWKEGGYNTTALYKFELGENSITYKTTGNVPGTVLNQFSMDEKDGYFRIATTKEAYAWGGKSSNNLYVLDKDLTTAGKIEDIAPGEKIYSVRFMGNRAYMVTFKNIDPLFVIDLLNPKNPTILGKLKIPGYSTYLHPYDENHIMGFGNEVDESIDADLVHSDDAVYYTAVQGMKIGMFDVTDVNHPKEMFKEVIGDRGTTSDLLSNHKALLFNKDKSLLAFPVTVYEIPGAESCYDYKYSSCPSTCRQICVPSSCSYDNGLQICTADCDGAKSCVATETYGKPVFDGAYVYNVDLTNGFKLKGKISHYSETDQKNMVTNGYADWEKTIQRAIYIGENLYTISRSAVKANLLSTLAEVKSIVLAGDTYSPYPVPLPL